MGKYLNSPKPAFQCGVCGNEVQSGAKACPSCGADHRTGLHGEAQDDGLDLPDDPTEFNYDEFMKREFGNSPKPAGLNWIWWVTAIVLIVFTAYAYLHGFFPW